MLAARAANPRGYFEDRETHELHERLLAHLRATWDAAPRLRVLRRRPMLLEPLDDEVSELIASLRSGGPWVWKNPRATLFAGDWARRIPEAQFVICVRSPAEVIESMERRGNGLRIRANSPLSRIRRNARALSVWHTYNRIAYEFALRHPDRVAVVRVPDDLPALAASTRPSLFDPALLTQSPSRRMRCIAGLAITSQLLYRQIRRLHDPGRLSALLAGPPSPARRP